MGHTLVEKILARVSGSTEVRAGDEVMAKPDFVVVYDFPGYTDVIFKQMKEDFGIDRVAEPDRFAIFIDHMVPVATAAEEQLHIQTRNWCHEQSVPLVRASRHRPPSRRRIGLCEPGAFVVHFDGHISQLGAFGTLGMGLRRNVLEAFVRDHVSLKVPETVRINLTGALQQGVMARDVFHHIVRVLGPAACKFQVMELGGPGIAGISLEGRQTICGLAMFTGAVTAIVNPDEMSLAYTGPRARLKIRPVYSDPDAHYAAVHEIDISNLEPVIVLPPNPSNTRNLVDHLGLDVHAGYLGSCASGRLEDLRIAAQDPQGSARQRRLLAACDPDLSGDHGSSRRGGADLDSRRGRRLHLEPQLRLLLRPHRSDVAADSAPCRPERSMFPAAWAIRIRRSTSAMRRPSPRRRSRARSPTRASICDGATDGAYQPPRPRRVDLHRREFRRRPDRRRQEHQDHQRRRTVEDWR